MAARRTPGVRITLLALAVIGAAAAVGACSDEVDSPALAEGATEPTADPSAPVTPRPPSTSTDGGTTSTSTTSTTTSSTTTSSTTTSVPSIAVGGYTCPGALTSTSSIWFDRPPSALPAPDLPDGWRTEVVGRSVQGRDIVALVRPVARARRTVVVIGGVHGNEPVSPPSVRGMVAGDYPSDVELWLVPAMNPDGSAAGTRCNAAGVDLNRNFPWGWRPDDGGPAMLSEPEPAAMVALIERLAPDLVVWVHQPYGYVSSIGATADALEEAWSTGSGLPVRPDVSQHGGGESWTAFEHGTASMLIEIGSWEATPDIVAAQRTGLEATILALG